MTQYPRKQRMPEPPNRSLSPVPTENAEVSIDQQVQFPSPTPPPVFLPDSLNRSPLDSFAPSTHTSISHRHAVESSVVWISMLVGLIVAATIVLTRVAPLRARQLVDAWPLAAFMPHPVLGLPNDPSVHPTSIEVRADAKLRRDGRSSIPGGVLFTPETLHSNDGGYDLFLFFHGNVQVIVESAIRAKLDAAIAIVNLGVGSGVYEDAYATPGSYDALLQTINDSVERRGLHRARIRRIALGSWSAGYGAVQTILSVRRGTDPLDAITVLDGIHCGWIDDHPGDLNAVRLAPWVEAAHAAASSRILFTVTYSEILPPTYAGTRETALHLLDAVRDNGTITSRVDDPPAYLYLDSMRGAVSKENEKRMEPFEDARIGELHLRGYRGNNVGHHMAHLFQMSATVLPELVARWSQPSECEGQVDAMRPRRHQPIIRRRGGS